MANLVGNILGIEGTDQNPRSSAVGPGQFIRSTWLDMVRKYHPELAQGRSDSQILALRTDPNYSALGPELTGAYARENQGILGAAGFQPNPGNTYLAHFAGPGGAVKVLSADPNTPVAQVLGPAVVQANPFLGGKTAGDVIQWARRKMGDTSTDPAASAPQFTAGDSPALGTPAPAFPSPSAPEPAAGGLAGVLAQMLGIAPAPQPTAGVSGIPPAAPAGSAPFVPIPAPTDPQPFLASQVPTPMVQFPGRPPMQLAPGPYLPAPPLKPGFYQGGLGSGAYGGIRG